jgi:phenylalanyl-tRNA synthetase beta chain
VKDGQLTVQDVAQPLMLAGAAWGGAVPEQWGEKKRAVDFFDVKADLSAVLPPNAKFVKASHVLLHPGRAARIEVDGNVWGWLGELHPQHLGAFELISSPIIFEINATYAQTNRAIAFEAVSKQPLVRRDVAFVLDQSVESEVLLGSLRGASDAIVRTMDVFDVYRGAGLGGHQKSVAIRVLMQDTERTLEDTEIDAAIQKLVAVAQKTLGATLRT